MQKGRLFDPYPELDARLDAMILEAGAEVRYLNPTEDRNKIIEKGDLHLEWNAWNTADLPQHPPRDSPDNRAAAAA